MSPQRQRPRRAPVGQLKLAWARARADWGLARRLARFARPHAGRLVLAWLAMSVYAAAGAGLAYTVKPIFDDVLIQGVNIGLVSAAILLLYLAKGVGAYFSTTLVASSGQA